MVYDIIIPLGGGRYNDGNLTELSRQRLDRAVKLYKLGKASKIFALGGHWSTYSPNAIRFAKTGAKIRRDYLASLGVPKKDIILVEDGRDTMLEAFATRKFIRMFGFKNVLLVTSDKHMRRSLFIFRRIVGEGIKIVGSEVPCGNILNENEEREYYKIVRKLLSKFPNVIPDPNLDTWISENMSYYSQHQVIKDKYHPPGKESQAYAGVVNIR